MSRRPTAAALVVEDELVGRATSAGQGNRSRARQHGDLAMYQWGPAGKDRADGCRCGDCVEGNRAYKRRYARQRLAGRGGGFVPLRDVRPHLRKLVRLGWQIQEIADAAEVRRAAVARIGYHGQPDDDVKRHVADAIRKIPAVAPHRLARYEIEQAMLDRAHAISTGRWSPDRDQARYLDEDSWKASAGCAGLDAESMQPGRGDPLTACRALCAVCPVKAPCAEAGVYERFGVWGGLSERERRVVRRQRGIRLDDDLALEDVA